MENTVSFNDASLWEEYYYNQGLDFVSSNRVLPDDIAICRCIRDNKDYCKKNPPIIKNKVGTVAKVSRYSPFNINYSIKNGVEKNEKAISFQMIDHPEWLANWERFKSRYGYLLYLKYHIGNLRNGMGIDQKDQDYETDDIDNDIVWSDEESSEHIIKMNVLPSPTMDDDYPEKTHVSLFAYTDSELICGKNFGHYEGDIKRILKQVEGIFDEKHNDVTDLWTIE